jgi:twitching motility protein PilT
MSLFPQGTSGFQTKKKKEEIKPKEETVNLDKEEKKEIKEEKKIEKEEEKKTEKIKIKPQEEEKNNLKQKEEEKPKNLDIKPEEEKKDLTLKEEDSEEYASFAEIFKIDFDKFPSSVKIAGINAPDLNLEEIDNDKPQISLEDEVEEQELIDNLDDESVDKLGDLKDKYFAKFSSSSCPEGGVSLDSLLDLAIDKDASDIHFSEKSQIGLRVHGKIYFIDNFPELNHEQTRYLIFSLVQSPLMRKKIYDERELDCSYEHQKTKVSFRVNIFFKRGRLAAVLRRIESKAKTIDELGIPDSIKSLLEQKQGLLLVTGPTGSGKSTSMQAMLEYINENRVEHILTIEDPIEYLFKNKKSIFSQREIGQDTYSFSNALRSSLREDPDIVMVGEMRDPETTKAAMDLSETGHLVISTLHTSSAPQTVSRLVSQFPPDEQHQVLNRLGDTLIGVLSQRLVPLKDEEGRIAIFELMIVNSAIRNIIKSGDMSQIHNAMLSGREQGMILMEDYAEGLVDRNVIDKDDYIHFFREE